MPLDRLRTLLQDARRGKGRWRLTRDHEIEYTSEGAEEEFSLKGPMVAVEPGQIVFAASEKTRDQKTVTRLVRLGGTWRAGASNEIQFSVDKKSGPPDVLRFRSAWRLSDRAEIIYTYSQTDLKTRRKVEGEIIFSGEWKLNPKRQLVYLVGGDNASALRFRAAIQTPSLLAKDGEIRFQLGGEASKTARTRTLTFFGKWKVSRSFGISFEVENGRRRKPIWKFGGEWSAGPGGRCSVQLTSASGEPFGAELVFTKSFFKDGDLFLRLERNIEESRVEAGARWTA